VSEFRIEKRRTEAALTLATGATIPGCFFLSGSRATHAGPERVADLLNSETGFFPFELASGTASHTVLYNRTQVVMVTLSEEAAEAQLDPGYAVAPEREVQMLLSTGKTIDGRGPEMFLYVETEGATVIVNSAHIVELRETNQA
jgi:hypothetical protein